MHQKLTFPVHPDPVSGMHCWHQKVRVECAELDDRYGDVSGVRRVGTRGTRP
jgi:hypothetical protein